MRPMRWRFRKGALAAAAAGGLLLCGCDLQGTGALGSGGAGGNAGAPGDAATGGGGGAGMGTGTDGGLPAPLADGDDLDLGHLDHLTIGLLGDTRPANPGGVYPQPIASHIFAEIGARAPDFVIALGDYIFVYPANETLAAAQMTAYKQAQAGYGGRVFYVLGNHESYGDNVVAFRQVLSPAAYYSLHGTTGAGGSTFKVVVLADDLWTTQQESWAQAALARPTSYTLVCRHHPSYNGDGQNPHILDLVRSHPLTLLLDGHTHLYNHAGSREVVLGNAGAPLDSFGDFYGYAMLDIGTDGRAEVRAYREVDDTLVDDFSVSP